MTKIILKKTTKYSAIFLAAILVAGTMALSNSSFMIGAHAQQFNVLDQRYNNYEQDYGQDNQYNSYEPEYGTDYGMNSYDKKPYGRDNIYDKSKDSSSVAVKKIKCNNINVNVNGDIDIGASQALGALATDDEAQAATDEGEVGANTLGSGSDRSDGGRPSGSDSDSRFVCIDNNDNVVVQEEPISELCEECFAANSALQTEIIEALVDLEDSITFSGPDYVLAIGSGTNTIEQVCAIIESSAEFYGAPIPADVFDQVFTLLLTGEFDVELPALDTLIECLLKEGIIVDTELAPESISDNPITTQSNNSIPTQSNNPITTTTTTQSSNIGEPQSSNIVP